MKTNPCANNLCRNKKMNEYTLPDGVYILNNGPKKKSVGGRFFNGRTHEDIKKLFQHKSNIKFTSKPEKADYVLLPESVREPGSKLLKRNPALADSRLWFSFDKIANSLYSKSYARAKKLKKKSSDSYTYVLNDVNSGRNKSLEIPSSIAPSGKAQFLLNNRKNPPYFSQFGDTYTSVVALDDTMPIQEAVRLGEVETQQNSIPTTSVLNTLVGRVSQQIQQLAPTAREEPRQNSFPAFSVQGAAPPSQTSFMTGEISQSTQTPDIFNTGSMTVSSGATGESKNASFVENMNYLASRIQFVTDTLEGFHFGSQQAIDMAVTNNRTPDQMKNVKMELKSLGEATVMINRIVSDIINTNSEYFNSQGFPISQVSSNNLQFVDIFATFQRDFSVLVQIGMLYYKDSKSETNKQNMIRLLTIIMQLQIDMKIVIKALEAFDLEYYNAFEGDLQASKNTTKCRGNSRVCSITDDTKDNWILGKKYDGEPAVHLMSSLSSSVCTLIKNLENEFNPDKALKLAEDFQVIEQRMDFLKDIRMYLYFQGYKNEGFLGNVSEIYPCVLLNMFQEELITGVKKEQRGLARASFGNMLNKLISLDLDKPLTRFLSDDPRSRQSHFAKLQTMIGKLQFQDRPAMWILCGIVSYIFFLRKYFSDPSNMQIMREESLIECFIFIEQTRPNIRDQSEPPPSREVEEEETEFRSWL